MDVFVYSDNPDHEYAYELVNEVEVRKIKFGGNGDPIAKDAVVVLELL